MLVWDCYGFQKKSLGHIMLNMCFASGGIRESPSVLWCVRGMKHRCTIFLARVGLVRIPEKACRDTLHQTFICASGGISRSHSAFCASSVRNIKAIFFMLMWERCRFQKKHGGTRYSKLFLDLFGSVGYVVHCGASGA
jgi:hypothetical protein